MQETLHPPSCRLEKYVPNSTIHLDPAMESGTDHHHMVEHSQEVLPPHSH